MILISAGLVLTAIVLLIAGFVLAKPFLVMWSIAVSVLSAVFLVIGALLRRHELFPGGDAGAPQPLPRKGPMPAGPLPAPHGVPSPSAPQQMMVRHGMQQAPVAPVQPRRGPVAGPATAAVRRGVLAPEAIVLVIPGRKRYHVGGCRQLVGRDHEELTHEEALEEGFTPCTTCLPADSASGPQPQETSPEARKPDGSLTTSGESGSVAGAREATARFTSPYQPVRPTAPSGEGSSGGQQVPGARPESQRPESQKPESQKPESQRLGEQQRSGQRRPESRGPEFQRPEAEAAPGRFEASPTGAESPVARRDAAPARQETSAGGRESTASRQETGSLPEAEPSQQDPVVPVARPYVRPSEPQPHKPASPPGRPAEQPTRPAIRLPKIPEIPHAASEATSWFSRDVVAQASGKSQEASAGPAGTPARPDSATAGSGSSGPSATDASASRAGASDPDEPDTAAAAPAKSGPAGSEHAEVEPTRPAQARPAKAEPAKSEATPAADPARTGGEGGNDFSAKAEPTTAGRETSPEPSGSSGREASATAGTPEPVEPAETAPGRAGRQVAADSTSAEPGPAPGKASTGMRSDAGPAGAGTSFGDARDDGGASDARDDDTSPGGIPAIKDRPRPPAEERETGGETVTVIAGTRRFHDSDCPLVKGAKVGGSGIETTTRAEAERAGLSNCPICRIDRRT